jgi:hypothetical protein
MNENNLLNKQENEQATNKKKMFKHKQAICDTNSSSSFACAVPACGGGSCMNLSCAASALCTRIVHASFLYGL